MYKYSDNSSRDNSNTAAYLRDVQSPLIYKSSLCISRPVIIQAFLSSPSILELSQLYCIIGQRHTKRYLWTFHIVYTKISPYTMLKIPIHKQIVYTARKISAIDVMIVKKCRPWPDAASETRRLVWVYTFCICPKVPFRMTLVIWVF